MHHKRAAVGALGRVMQESPSRSLPQWQEIEHVGGLFLQGNYPSGVNAPMQHTTKTITVSVLTPTYNRGHLLKRVYDSLLKQTFQDFEWLIIDDGSTDDTKAISENIIADNLLNVRYYFRENGGRHRAINYAVEKARGLFVAELHSDDQFVPTALERFVRRWEEMPKELKYNMAGIVALCAEENGSIIGGPLTDDYIDSNAIEIRTKHKRVGDFISMHRTDMRREFLFPEIPGENYIPPALLWNRIAHKYMFRYINEVLGVKQYLKDGITSRMRGVLIKAPKGLQLWYEERIMSGHSVSMSSKIKNHINYVRFSLHAGESIRKAYKRIPAEKRVLIAMPVGVALYCRDRLKVIRNNS